MNPNESYVKVKINLKCSITKHLIFVLSFSQRYLTTSYRTCVSSTTLSSAWLSKRYTKHWRRLSCAMSAQRISPMTHDLPDLDIQALFKTFNLDAYKIYIYIYPVMDMTTVYRYDLQICALFWDPTRVKCNLSNIVYIRSGNNTISQYSYLSLINFHCNFQSSIVTHACLQLQCL